MHLVRERPEPLTKERPCLELLVCLPFVDESLQVVVIKMDDVAAAVLSRVAAARSKSRLVSERPANGHPHLTATWPETS